MSKLHKKLVPVVFSRPINPPWGDKPWGYPYANKRYLEVARGFAAGREIENWNDGGWFDMEGRHYQVVSSGPDICVILRRTMSEMLALIREEGS